MNGELALTIALIAYGNARLRDSTSGARDLRASSSVFRSVGSISFGEVVEGRPVEIANDVGRWLTWLLDHQVERLHLATTALSGPLPGHIAAGFAGGGAWVIVATTDRAGSCWTPQWEFREGDAARPWHVSCMAVPIDHPLTFDPLPLTAARHDLGKWLTAAEQLADDLSEQGWKDWFRAALDQLTAARPQARFHDDALPPAGYSASARQVFAAAVGAWVFGGMGSWNDLVVEADALRHRYDEVSESLFRSALAAFEAVLESDRDTP